MLACSIGDVTVLTGVAGLRVVGVNCDFTALSFECSIGSHPLFVSANCGKIVGDSNYGTGLPENGRLRKVWYGWELLYPRPSFLHCPSLTLLLDYNVPEMPPRFSKAVCVSLVIVPVLIQLASAADFDWKSLIPQIRKVLNQTFPGEGIEEHYNIAIYGTGDVTGDGIPEAIVYVGTGGASTDEV